MPPEIGRLTVEIIGLNEGEETKIHELVDCKDVVSDDAYANSTPDH